MKGKVAKKSQIDELKCRNGELMDFDLFQWNGSEYCFFFGNVILTGARGGVSE